MHAHLLVHFSAGDRLFKYPLCVFSVAIFSIVCFSGRSPRRMDIQLYGRYENDRRVDRGDFVAPDWVGID